MSRSGADLPYQPKGAVTGRRNLWNRVALSLNRRYADYSRSTATVGFLFVRRTIGHHRRAQGQVRRHLHGAADRPDTAGAVLGLSGFPAVRPSPAAVRSAPRVLSVLRRRRKLRVPHRHRDRREAGSGPACGVGDVSDALPTRFPVLVPGQLFSRQILRSFGASTPPRCTDTNPTTAIACTPKRRSRRPAMPRNRRRTDTAHWWRLPTTLVRTRFRWCTRNTDAPAG